MAAERRHSSPNRQPIETRQKYCSYLSKKANRDKRKQRLSKAEARRKVLRESFVECAIYENVCGTWHPVSILAWRQRLSKTMSLRKIGALSGSQPERPLMHLVSGSKLYRRTHTNSRYKIKSNTRGSEEQYCSSVIQWSRNKRHRHLCIGALSQSSGLDLTIISLTIKPGLVRRFDLPAIKYHNNKLCLDSVE